MPRDFWTQDVRQIGVPVDDEPEVVQRVVRRDGRTVSVEQLAREQEEQQRREREEAERKRKQAPKILTKRWVPGEGVVTVAVMEPNRGSDTSKEEKGKPGSGPGQGDMYGRRY